MPWLNCCDLLSLIYLFSTFLASVSTTLKGQSSSDPPSSHCVTFTEGKWWGDSCCLSNQMAVALRSLGSLRLYSPVCDSLLCYWPDSLKSCSSGGNWGFLKLSWGKRGIRVCLSLFMKQSSWHFYSLWQHRVFAV